MSADKAALEEGSAFTPRFDANGLIVCVTVEAGTREILMVAYMNQLALDKTIETGVAHYWSRSRNALWRKGDTSGQVQRVVSLSVDCDQDAQGLPHRPQILLLPDALDRGRRAPAGVRRLTRPWRPRRKFGRRLTFWPFSRRSLAPI
jgi:phosphoribosyl-AMP cyclohydrolase